MTETPWMELYYYSLFCGIVFFGGVQFYLRANYRNSTEPVRLKNDLLEKRSKYQSKTNKSPGYKIN